MIAPPAAQPLFPAAHHMPFAYPSPASTIASDSSLHWSVMSPPQELYDPLPSRKSTSSSPKAQSAGNADLRWITGNKPDDFKTKSVMQAVRRTAMGSYLKTAKNNAGDKSRANSEASDKSRSSFGSQGATKPRPIKTPKGKGKSDSEKRHALPKEPSQPKSNNQRTPNPDTQVARQSTLPQRPIVIPIRTGHRYPFDLYPVPTLISLGQSFDPFQTMFQSGDARVDVTRLKYECSRYFGTKSLGQYWIPECLKYAHTFLSTLYMASAYDDVMQNRKVESLETAALRQDVIHFVSGNLTNPEQGVADHNIIAVSQLILGEVISRTEAGLRFHQDGMATMIKQRGGLHKLGVNGQLASAVSWANLAIAVLREVEPTPMYVEYCLSHSTKRDLLTAVIPESPLYYPHGKFVTIERSLECNPDARKIMDDVRTMIEELLDAKSSSRTRNSLKLRSLHDRINRYPSVQQLQATAVLREADWRYEAIRLIAIVQARAIIDQAPLSEALESVQSGRTQSTMYSSSTASHSNDSVSPTFEAQHVAPLTGYCESPTFGSYSDSFTKEQYGFPSIHRPSESSTQSERPSLPSFQSSSSDLASRPQALAPTSSRPTILQQLRDTINKSNLSGCWSDMAGVLLWIGLVMGAASSKSGDKLLRSYFSATAMRACIMLCFEHPEAIHCTMLRMTNITEALSKKPDDGQLVRKDSGVSRKRTKA